MKSAQSIRRAKHLNLFFQFLYLFDTMSAPFSGSLDSAEVINPAGHADPEQACNPENTANKTDFNKDAGERLVKQQEIAAVKVSR